MPKREGSSKLPLGDQLENPKSASVNISAIFTWATVTLNSEDVEQERTGSRVLGW
jgi:hypothetical protein